MSENTMKEFIEYVKGKFESKQEQLAYIVGVVDMMKIREAR